MRFSHEKAIFAPVSAGDVAVTDPGFVIRKRGYMQRLMSRVAVVTGASKGIGAAIAEALGAEGASVLVNYSNDRAGADRTVTAIIDAGGQGWAIQGDVSKIEDVKRLLFEAKSRFGRLDILVNNAAVFTYRPFEEFTEDEFHRQMNINVLGTLLMTHEALDCFGPDGGSIINIGSLASTKATPTLSVYVATKSAVNGMTKVLAKELGRRKIRVNSVNPGATNTEGAHSAGIVGGPAEKALVAATPLGRIGHPEDIAKVVVFLASDEAGWVTGEVITASGGLS